MVAITRLVFATNNAHKIEEAQAIVAGKLQLISLKEAGFDIDVDETGSTFHENAYLKAQAVFEATGLPCVADDSGLCVDVLNGAPGVYSARYAGEPVSHSANNVKLLAALEGEEYRNASFRTVLCVMGLDVSQRPLYFEGKVDGEILKQASGSDGFGYDPIFQPKGFVNTFAEMSAQQKNALSHRGKAFEQLMSFLQREEDGAVSSMVPALPVMDFDYDLPTDRIAFEAVEPRDASRLLVYKGNLSGDGSTEDKQFSELGDCLGAGDVLVANDTRVIPARLHGRVVGGAEVEVFLLNPMDADWLQWEVMVGNRKKFRENDVVEVVGDAGSLRITWLDRERNRVNLFVGGGFSAVQDAIECLGAVPLPPYIERAVREGDKDRYQAIFAEHAGAVAAPTASLHFTEALRNRLMDQGVRFSYLTLHVGAGTFKPMSSDYANEHEMHAERFAITVPLIDMMLDALQRDRRVVAIGTTSMRVLESIYFVGCRLLQGCWDGMISCDDGYDLGLKLREGRVIGMEEALLAVREFALNQGGVIQGQTQIFIIEGFDFRVVRGLITNFHQPKSTLLMLISAFVGADWRSIYGFAMGRGYRFLSYGDGSLLWR